MANLKDVDQVHLEETSSGFDIQKSNDPVTLYRTYSADEVAAIEKRLVRKLDSRILPTIVLIYILNYLDRNSITQARLYGLQKDAHVEGAMWQTAISILSVGYVAMQIPSTLYMAKTKRPSLFLPICMMVWAVVSGCTAFVTSTASLLTVRFFLGVVEAPFFPCAIYYLSCWYKKSELGIRMALLVSGLILSNAFAGLIAAGILKGMQGVSNLSSWQWLFIIEALITIVVAFCAIFILPDYPATTKWLSEEERNVAQARLAIDVGSEEALTEDNPTILRSLLHALKDYRVWLFAGMQMSCTASISFSHFFPTLVKGLGFKSNTTTLLLTSPPYCLAFFWALAIAFIADRRQIRSTYAGISATIALIGGIAIIALPEHSMWPKYAMMFFLVLGTYGVYCTTYTWLSSTIPRPPAKRAASIGIANSLANLASFYGNYFWLDQYGPAYRQSWGIVLAFITLCLACILTLRFVLSRMNKSFDQLATQLQNGEIQRHQLTVEEVSALDNGFRYVI